MKMPKMLSKTDGEPHTWRDRQTGGELDICTDMNRQINRRRDRQISKERTKRIRKPDKQTDGLTAYARTDGQQTAKKLEVNVT